MFPLLRASGLSSPTNAFGPQQLPTPHHLAKRAKDQEALLLWGP